MIRDLSHIFWSEVHCDTKHKDCEERICDRNLATYFSHGGIPVPNTCSLCVSNNVAKSIINAKSAVDDFQTGNLDLNHEELSQISTFAIRWSTGQPLNLQKRKLACFASNGRAHSAKIPMYWLYLQIFIVQTERNSIRRARYYTTKSSYIFFPNFELCN